MADPNSPGEWFALAAQHERSARVLAEDKFAAGQAMFHAGLAVECALKAYIMNRERLNGWPSKETRPELYVHDIHRLREIVDLSLDARSPQASGWHLFLQWDRGQAYDPQPMPRKAARSWVDAAFGKEGL